MKDYFVHYTVRMPPAKTPQHCTAGPYSMDDVTMHKQDIAGYSHVSDVFVSELPQHPELKQ